jgi:hypothetical protein
MTINELRAYLEAHSIPVSTWGTGESKTLEHLLAEINEGESVLQEQEGKLLRISQASALTIYYEEGGRRLVLREKEQVFADGRRRVRDFLRASIFEKMKRGENPEEVARRALKEELGIEELLPLKPGPHSPIRILPSESFPGLVSVFSFYNFDVFLPARLYKPEGYVEVQKDKSTYFVWELVPAGEAPR